MTNPGIVGVGTPARGAGLPNGTATLDSTGNVPSSQLNNPRYLNDLNVYNLTDANLHTWRAAVAQVRAGNGEARAIFLGDSIATSTGATAWTNGFGPKFASIFATKSGLTAREGLVRITNPYQGTGVVDSRYTLGTGWTNTGGMGWGFVAATAASGGTGTLDFNPGINTTSFNVYGLAVAGQTWGFQANIDGGAFTSYTFSPPSGVANGTIYAGVVNISSGTAGAHTISVKPPASGNAPIIGGIEAINTGSRAIRWGQQGQSGNTTTNMAASFSGTNASATLEMLAQQPALVGVLMSTNDQTGGVNPATVTSNLVTIGNSILTSSPQLGAAPSLIFIVPPPLQLTTYPFSSAQYAAAIDAAALTLGCAVIHTEKRWRSYAVSNPSPFSLYFDGAHPNDNGHADIATAIANLALSVS